MKNWIVIIMFVGCLALSSAVIFIKGDKSTSEKTLALLGSVITGYLGGKLLEEDKPNE